jgi:hypothetical protein
MLEFFEMKEKSTITVEDHQPNTIGRMRLVRADGDWPELP